MLHVYDIPVPDGYYSVQPTGEPLLLLNADWFMWLFPFILIGIIVGVCMLVWKIHDIPHHRAQHLDLPQTGLIVALTLLGWVVHVAWIFALVLAFINWHEIENGLTRILRNALAPSVKKNTGSMAEPSSDIKNSESSKQPIDEPIETPIAEDKEEYL